MDPVGEVGGAAELPFEQFFAALRAGDEVAWTSFFDRVLPRATRAIQAQLGFEAGRPDGSGADAVQSACRSVYELIVDELRQAGSKAGREFRAPRSLAELSAFFIRVAVNKCISRYRRRRGRLSLTDAGGEAEPSDRRPGPDEELMQEATVAEVQRAVALVADRLRKRNAKNARVFRLKVRGQMSTAEVAREVGLSEARVRGIWHDALRELRELLEGSFLEGED